MLVSLKHAVLGGLTRVGLDGDNLDLIYTNPALMRAFSTGWLGYAFLQNFCIPGCSDSPIVLDTASEMQTLPKQLSGLVLILGQGVRGIQLMQHPQEAKSLYEIYQTSNNSLTEFNA